MEQPCVYVLTNRRNGALFVGVTSNLVKQVREHRSEVLEGLGRRYRVHQLVWYETHESMESAVRREKELKEWRRKWKLELIEASNPTWRDLLTELV
jgi:putative endonuclease